MWDAFDFLSGGRGYAVGMSAAIPLGLEPSEVETVLRLWRVRDPDLADEWVFLIREMDREYRAIHDEQLKRQADKGAKVGNTPPRH